VKCSPRRAQAINPRSEKMSYPQPEQRYTLEEYYALDKASDRRWEFWDGEIICMSGGSKEHATIQGNVLKGV
jgi:Uma2 family endonuclease